MIDKLVAEENAKQWENREKQWDREDQARINLLKNVYANREQDIELKKKLKKLLVNMPSKWDKISKIFKT